MKLRFSMRCLFFLPVIVFVALQLAINFEMPDLPRRPHRRWNVELMDASGTVLSSQQELPAREPYTYPYADLLVQGFTKEQAEARLRASLEDNIPRLQEGKYIVRTVFPGIKDSIVNLFAVPQPRKGAAQIRVEVGEGEGMTLVDDTSGQVVGTFVGHSKAIRSLPPGRYSLDRMSTKQLDDWKADREEESKALMLKAAEAMNSSEK